MARLIAIPLAAALGQNVVIENRAGATGAIGTQAVVSAPRDGHTLLLVLTAHAIGAALYEKQNFNFVRDIAPVASIYRGPGVLVVHPSFQVKSVPELIGYAKSNPGKSTWRRAVSGAPSMCTASCSR